MHCSALLHLQGLKSFFLYIALQGLLAHFGLHADQEVACHFKTQPAGSHAGSDLEESGDYAFVESPNAFLANYDPDGVYDAFILVTHTRHGVYLEPSSKNVTNQESVSRPPPMGSLLDF